MEASPDVSPVLFFLSGQATSCDKIQMTRSMAKREHFHPATIQDRPDDIHHLLDHEEHWRREKEGFFWQDVLHLPGNLRDGREQVQHCLVDPLEMEDFRTTMEDRDGFLRATPVSTHGKGANRDGDRAPRRQM
jgi:hypothetical protein